MSTQYYLRQAVASIGPIIKFSTDTDNYPDTPVDKAMPYEMSASIGVLMASVTGVYSTNGSMFTLARKWVGPPLAAQTLTGGLASYQVAIAISESHVQMNLLQRTFGYIWRPTPVPTNIKIIFDPVSATEHDTAITECVITTDGLAGNFDILNMDRIVIEEWWNISNTKGTNYTATFYFDGTDTTFVDGTVTTSAGSYFWCPQTLTEYSGDAPPPGISYSAVFIVNYLRKMLCTTIY